MEKIIHVLYTLNCGFKYIYIYIEREKEINNVGMKNLYETKKIQYVEKDFNSGKEEEREIQVCQPLP